MGKTIDGVTIKGSAGTAKEQRSEMRIWLKTTNVSAKYALNITESGAFRPRPSNWDAKGWQPTADEADPYLWPRITRGMARMQAPADGDWNSWRSETGGKTTAKLFSHKQWVGRKLMCDEDRERVVEQALEAGRVDDLSTDDLVTITKGH